MSVLQMFPLIEKYKNEYFINITPTYLSLKMIEHYVIDVLSTVSPQIQYD